METIELLKKIRLLQDLGEDELKKFAAVCSEETFPSKSIIIEENMEGRSLYIVKKGTVVVSKVEGETETEITKLVVGETFGEMSLIEDTKTSARVSAYNDVTCISIDRASFLNLMKAENALSSKVWHNFTRILSERLRYTSQELFTWKPDMHF